MNITPISQTEGQKFQQHIEEHLGFFAVFQNVYLFIPRFFVKAQQYFVKSWMINNVNG
jgi:hypothetical protein